LILPPPIKQFTEDLSGFKRQRAALIPAELKIYLKEERQIMTVAIIFWLYIIAQFLPAVQ
jgi:hypothetical protein